MAKASDSIRYVHRGATTTTTIRPEATRLIEQLEGKDNTSSSRFRGGAIATTTPMKRRPEAPPTPEVMRLNELLETEEDDPSIASFPPQYPERLSSPPPPTSTLEQQQTASSYSHDHHGDSPLVFSSSSSSSRSRSNNSLDTESLLQFIDDFSIGSGAADKTLAAADIHIHETPRLNNRTSTSSTSVIHRAHPTLSPCREENVDVNHSSQQKQQQLQELQQWSLRLRNAIQSWVQEQKHQQEREHSKLREHLQQELQKQQAAIVELQSSVVEWQQDCLRQLLLLQKQPKATNGGDNRNKTILPVDVTQNNGAGLQQPQQQHQLTHHRPSSSSSRRHQLLEDGTRITVYANGARKEQRDDGSCVIHFGNGDIQTFGRDGKMAYWFASTRVVKVVENQGDGGGDDGCSGTTLYQFPNGQIERHYADGRKVVQFPNTARWVQYCS